MLPIISHIIRACVFKCGSEVLMRARIVEHCTLSRVSLYFGVLRALINVSAAAELIDMRGWAIVERFDEAGGG